ncbi:radical SAM/SPASM domain-containing protein [Nitrosopumilus ureiphilus]|uniref:Radical SAM protein n=1 Tax=Nitrosopumilus ureiphilus TaxID=1470067 RepID=A0A7D5RFM9_9ARCH|nr:radical SAM protein [Nitrosopumilus ureiphilus]QLH05805.1 radical SAM protein [Nitrosopumilus ureiphilus]
MQSSKLYTTDGKVKWFSNENDVNEKLISILGEKFEKYREKWNAVNRFELETNFPLFLQIETNQICNLQCPSCPIGTPEAHKKYITTEKMPSEIFERIILEGEKYECPSVEPQGTNEPLLDNNLEKQIKFASKHGFIDIMLNTNATLLSESRARSMLKSGITRFRFSLDAATKETYEKVRLGAKYDITMKNIENFLKIKKEERCELPVVGVNFVKQKTNEHEEKKFIETWIDRVDFIVIQEFQTPDVDHDYSDFLPTESDYREKLMNDFRCQQPWQRILIRSTGEVCPCCAFFSTELSLGNIKNKTIYELWNGQEMKYLRQLHKNGIWSENSWCKKCVNGMCGNFDSSELLNIKTNS